MELWSATARIGEARAMLYPRISLTGSYGLASDDLSELIDPASQTWNLFANLMQPIFEGGKNTARVEMRESQHRQALYAYQRTLLNALREVEDALVGFRSAGQQRTALRERVVAERKVLELSTLRYKGGVADYLEVLDSQRMLFDAEISEVNAASEHVEIADPTLQGARRRLAGAADLGRLEATGARSRERLEAAGTGSGTGTDAAPAPAGTPAPAATPAPAPPAAPAPPK